MRGRLRGRCKGAGLRLCTLWGPHIGTPSITLRPDLLLDRDTLDRLTDDAACAALAGFSQRVTFANCDGDFTVPFETSSLLDAHEFFLVQAI